MRSASRRTDALAAVLALALIAATARSAAQTPAPPWQICAGGAQGAPSIDVRRLTSLADKALVEADIARVFAQREKEQRVSRERLAAARVSIDFLYAAGSGTSRLYYYEASKTIHDAEGVLRVSVAGWLRGEGAEPRSLGAKSELQWLELAEESFGDREIPEPAPIPEPKASLVPVGVIRRANDHVWVMRRAIGNGTVLVYEVGPSGVRLRPTKCS